MNRARGLARVHLPALILVGLALATAGWAFAERWGRNDSATGRAQDEVAQSMALLLEEWNAVEGREERTAEELQKNLAACFERLAEQYGESDSQTLERLRSLQEQIESIDRRLCAIDDRLDSLSGQSDASGVEEAEAQEVEPKPDSTAGSETVRGIDEPTRDGTRSTLSFSDLLRVDSAVARTPAVSRYVLVEGACRAGFDGTSNIHDFSGATDRVAGEFTVQMGDPENAPHGAVRIDVTSLSTGNDARDATMREDHLQTALFPTIEFELKEIRGVEPLADGSHQARVLGTMRCHGVERGQEVLLSYQKIGRSLLRIRGEWKLRMSDFGIEPPVALGGMVRTKDELKAWFVLQARRRDSGS